MEGDVEEQEGYEQSFSSRMISLRDNPDRLIGFL